MKSKHKSLRLTVGGLKGGTGKTTTAVMLAFALHRQDPDQIIHLIDADDSNASTWDWSEMAGEKWPENIIVNRWASPSVAKRVSSAVPDDVSVVIDTGPHSAAILRAALTVTERLIVPLAPTPVEATRLTPTLEAAAEVAALRPISLHILLNRVVPNTLSAAGVAVAISDELKLPLLKTRITRRELYAQAQGRVPSNVGAYRDLLDELQGLNEDE